MSKHVLDKLRRRIRKGWAAALGPWPRFERYALSNLTRTTLRLERIGSDYGGWYVPVEWITPQSVCYLAGVGEDITFDLGLVQKCGCQVEAFDPTPRASQHVAKVARDVVAFRFHEIGLWSEEATMRFFAPRDPRHVSHSIVNLQQSESFFDARCRPIGAIMHDLGHTRIDLLKLDIEGAEHRVIASMLDDGIRPTIVAAEFDQPAPYRRMRDTFEKLLSANYSFVKLDGLNLTFVQRSRLP